MIAEKVAASINETVDLTGLGRTTVFRLIKENKLRTVKVGRRTLVPMSEIRALVDGKAA